MASNTHEHDQIVVSKEITQNEEQMKSSLQLDDDNVENKGVVENISSDNEAIVLNDNNELFHIEGEVNICDTCGDVGFEKLLAICDNCKVGAEHTYCMIVKADNVPATWLCNNCTEDENEHEDGMQEGKENEETSSKKRKLQPFFEFFKMAKKTSQGRLELLNTQSYSETVGLDLNKDPNLDLNVDPNIDLNVDFGIDMNQCPNTDLSLGHPSYFHSGSSSNSQAQNPKMVFLREHFVDEEEEEEEQCAKKYRADTWLSL